RPAPANGRYEKNRGKARCKNSGMCVPAPETGFPASNANQRPAREKFSANAEPTVSRNSLLLRRTLNMNEPRRSDRRFMHLVIRRGTIRWNQHVESHDAVFLRRELQRLDDPHIGHSSHARGERFTPLSNAIREMN